MTPETLVDLTTEGSRCVQTQSPPSARSSRPPASGGGTARCWSQCSGPTRICVAAYMLESEHACMAANAMAACMRGCKCTHACI
eukprot:355050-Chlamydomonas_euryale.AAC.2